MSLGQNRRPQVHHGARTRTATIATVVAIVALLSILVPSASALPSYTLGGTFSTGTGPLPPFGPCVVKDLDIDLQENLYALCGGLENSHGPSGTVLRKWDKDGNPVPFTGNYPWITGNTIFYDPNPAANGSGGLYGSSFGSAYDTVAVDRSSGPTSGYIYVSRFYTGPGTEAFRPDGKWMGMIAGSGTSTVDESGNIYLDAGYASANVKKYDPSWTFLSMFNLAGESADFGINFGESGMSTDSNGGIWGIGNVNGSAAGSVSKIEDKEFGPPQIESAYSTGKRQKGDLSPYVDSPVKLFGKITADTTVESLEVDQHDDNVFLLYGNPRAIAPVSPGTPAEVAHQIGESIGAGQITSPTTTDGLAIGPTSRDLYVANGANIVKFTAGPPLPTVRVTPAQDTDIGHTDAIVRANIELSGGSPITSCEVHYGLTSAYEKTALCSPNPASAPPGSNFVGDTQVSVPLSGLSTNSTYRYAFVAGNAAGKGLGVERSFTPSAVLRVKTLPATNITPSSATLNGSFDPDGISTTYYYKYGLGEYTQQTAPVAPVSSTGDLAIAMPIADLKPNALYRYRLVATNSMGVTQGPERTFRTSGLPTISGLQATNVLAASADLNAKINPEGVPTTYQFEYGPNSQYGSTAPLGVGSVGEGETAQLVTESVNGLQPGVVHFRVKATNKYGTTTSRDVGFNFMPPSCPNEHVRQQAKSSYLPDCRAYELVSPASAGGLQIFPGNEVYTAGAFGSPVKQIGVKQTIQNTGLAMGPSRFAYYGGLGAATGIDAPNAGLDTYVATRTNEGWVTTFPGLKGNEAGVTGRRMCSARLDYCIDHQGPNFLVGETPENAGFLFDVSGRKLGDVPTNVKSIENGVKFIGDSHPSPDFSHLFFSSRNVIFAPGGTTKTPGSVYDNNLATKSVETISWMPNGDPIGSDSSNAIEFINLPPGGVSTDGSHVLMQTEAASGPNHLYLRVNDAITYDISNGAGVRFVGMTEDGTSITFIASQALVAEDTDHSADLYRWDENGGSPSLTVLSQANGAGDSDECDASWTDKCSVGFVVTKRGDHDSYLPKQYLTVKLGGPDSKIARENGAVYFYSPEQLAGEASFNGKNLYLARNGEIQYIGTLAADTGVDRLQISPDGAFSGLLTKAQLTAYDNAGYAEMYAYDANEESLVCASCMPSGDPPSFDVEASQNGPFMTDDGRVFFSTSDMLIPADTDRGNLPDVYEFVEGRPQLISSGVGVNARASGGANYFATELVGLESVSADGTDVFFSTTDTLVPQDANGQFVKIYNARTNGGFEPATAPAPCVAADECHGPGAPTPAPIQVGTGSKVTGGNHGRSPTAKPRSAKRCKKAKRNGKRQGKKKSCSAKARKGR
jgi:hypothetical protein